ncbi:unnamed protein product [Bursaphelenchus xylophilus]|uniref:(pine wood nematode) hypothetical protein n=1 Tax=Bursaphelenchus xylophilus TaxID=6326 RepID=A0A1I7SE13_BURXY|nr:unnamed protein product [Bursaphelenchus xylophilus]CAG9113179.1 unnamed protein product [Bursaphelenchus xylophilus]
MILVISDSAPQPKPSKSADSKEEVVHTKETDKKLSLLNKGETKLSSNQAPGYNYGQGNQYPIDTSFNGAMRAMGLPPLADGP